MTTAKQQDALYELEKLVESRIRKDRAEEISGLLAEAELSDIIRLIEHSPVKRGAVLFRLLPPERAGAVFLSLIHI